MRRSNRNFNIPPLPPPQAKARAFELLSSSVPVVCDKACVYSWYIEIQKWLIVLLNKERLLTLETHSFLLLSQSQLQFQFL